MARLTLASLASLALTVLAPPAFAARSAELYTTQAYGFGRIEARVRFAAGDGVIGSFFMWKDGSEQAGTFWNELDFEKLGADCHLQTNPIYGNPSKNHSQSHALAADLCGQFHTYAYEWTPDYIAWFVDGMEIRRETGAAMAYATNASQGMQIHFNVWPGDATFGGNFNPSILPVHEYVDWVQYSSYSNGSFKNEWREDFNGTALPASWVTGNWMSPKNLSTHDAGNVNLLQGYAVLSLTADNAVGPAGAMPGDTGGTGGGMAAGGSGATGAAGSSTTPGGSASAGGSAPTSGGTGTNAGAPAAAGSAGSAASLPLDGGTCALPRTGAPRHGWASLLLVTAVALARWRRNRSR